MSTQDDQVVDALAGPVVSRWNAARRFALSVAASLTAMGIVGLLRWLREPVVGARSRAL